MLGKLAVTPISLSLIFIAQFSFAGADPSLVQDGKSAIARIYKKVTVEQPLCFGREYSSLHLGLHPLKTVKKITARFSTEPQYNTKIMQLELILKGEQYSYKVFKAFMVCLPESGSCHVECDGGSVYLKSSDDDKVSVINQGFVAQGACGEDGQDLDTIFIEAKKDGDDVFKLKRLPSEFCQTK
ncbi:MAG: hypothetical protein V4736_14035 [Bdellovibrionota bacterium]